MIELLAVLIVRISLVSSMYHIVLLCIDICIKPSLRKKGRRGLLLLPFFYIEEQAARGGDTGTAIHNKTHLFFDHHLYN